jgi:hypothetical protein
VNEEPVETQPRQRNHEMNEAMKRRLNIMIEGVRRFSVGGKSKNEGVTAALLRGLYEIQERFELALDMQEQADARMEGKSGPDVGRAISTGQVSAFYPVIRRMYDTIVEYRVVEPKEATEPTFRDLMRQQANGEPLDLR